MMNVSTSKTAIVIIAVFVVFKNIKIKPIIY